MLKRRQLTLNQNLSNRLTRVHGLNTHLPKGGELNTESRLYTRNAPHRVTRMPQDTWPVALRCPICDTPLVDRHDYMNHLKSIHPSFVVWGRKNARNSVIAIAVVTGFVLTSGLLLPGNRWVLFLGGGSFVAVVAITISYTVMIRRRFRRASKDQNDGSTP